jgi:Alpha/beta hydrolase family
MLPFYPFRWPRFLQISRMVLVFSMMLAIFQLRAHAQGKERSVKHHPTSYRTIQVDGLSIFYREAGPKDAPTLLLLHGLPSSSRMFEPLFSRLSDRYHLVAPGYPGFGHSDWPDPKTFAYTFDNYVERVTRDRGSNRSGRRFAQRRSGGELEAPAGLLGRSRCQRKYASHKSALAGDDADAPCRERS